MSTSQRNRSGASAAERFFRAYDVHCVSPDRDSLFNLLNASHSLNDRLRKDCNADFFSLREFIAIKVLRNLFHHQEELLSQVKLVAAASLPTISTDLMFLCLVRKSLVENAIAGVAARRRANEEPLVRAVLKWYGDVVNINPCIFNFAVHVHEKVKELRLELDCPAYTKLQESYEFEEQNGYTHFVSGDIMCHAGSVEVVLKTVFADAV